jgi:phosphoribosylaminoimidazole-succinocarboxamide synthase
MPSLLAPLEKPAAVAAIAAVAYKTYLRAAEVRSRNSRLVAAATSRTRAYLPRIESAREAGACVATTRLPTSILPPGATLEAKYKGKVRDVYVGTDTVVLVATDRQSAFDRHLASVPFKGAVLSTISKWWFHETEHLCPNHLIRCPHANVAIGKKVDVFQVEFVMRGYITGSTDTSMWTHYKVRSCVAW